MKIKRKINEEIKIIQLRAKFQAEKGALLEVYFGSQIPVSTGAFDL